MKLFKKAHNMNMHIIIGLIILFVLYYLNLQYKWIELPTDTPSIIKLAVIGIIYSLMPDCDQPGSKINKYVTIGLIIAIIFSFYNVEYQMYGIIAAVILGLLRLIEHRTLIHSVLGGLIISAPLLYFGFIYFLVGFIVFIAHIVSDNDFSFGWEKDIKLW